MSSYIYLEEYKSEGLELSASLSHLHFSLLTTFNVNNQIRTTVNSQIT